MHSLLASSRSSLKPCASMQKQGARPRTRLVKTGFRTDSDRDSVTAVLTKPNTITIPQPNGLPPLAIKIPRSIHDVDSAHTVGFGEELAEDHPGFHDEAYKKRRLMIVDIARKYKVGDPIPRVDYTPEEVGVWGTALSNLRAMYPKYACKEFNQALAKLNFRDDEVPQLQDILDTLKAATGWQVRPTAGLMHPRDFLAGFAFKYFHSTQYMRHASKPMYTPEPDIVHELLGHVAMLADPTFAEIVQSIGQASLGADDKTIKHLTKVFWYTVEFGVIREGDGVKAFGAAILSSYGELEHLAKGEAELSPFDPLIPQPKMIHKGGYQPRYFVMDSFEAGLKQLKDYAATLNALN